MEEIGCVFCASKGNPVAIRENGWEGRKCVQCGLIYVSPRPSVDEVLELYGHDAAYTDSSILLGDGAYRRFHARHSLRILKHYLRRGDLLEIGAGAGFFLQEARRQGFQSFAIEPNPTQSAFIRSHGILCEEKPLAEAFAGREFDVIYHCDVTSHFHDLIGEFQRMRGRIRPGGILMFETGNFADVAPEHYRLISRFQYPDHLFFLGRKSLAALMAAAGFRLARQYCYGTSVQMALAQLTKRTANGARDANRTARVEAAKLEPDSTKKRIKAYVRFALTYRLGRFLRPEAMPQTIITVAQSI